MQVPHRSHLVLLLLQLCVVQLITLSLPCACACVRPQIANRLFYRYGIPKYVPEEDRDTAKFISSKLAVAFMPNIMSTLASYAAGVYIERRVVMLCM